MRRTVYTDDHEAFREKVKTFIAEHVEPHYDAWEDDHRPSRAFFKAAGDAGILGIGVPEEHGGLAGSTFKHSAIVTEEVQRHGFALGGLRVQTDICMPYFLEYATDEQKERWLPGLVRGDKIAALAMSEPGAGSDMKAMATRAKREDDVYLVNGAKTFISNGMQADLLILAAKTDPAAGRKGITLMIVETDDAPGYERGRVLEKIGQHAQDLAELFFTDTPVPVANRLGEENRGFEYLSHNLASERLSIAINSQAHAAGALRLTAERVAERGADQHAKFELAACATEVAACQALIDQALEANEIGELELADAAATKLYATEVQGRVVDRCLQLIGPDGYDRRSPIGRAYADARVSRIYGGSSEIMKVIVAKQLGL